MPALKKIRMRGPLVEPVYKAIKYAYLTSQIAPGSALYEEPLTKLLGVSRTPLREAFKFRSIVQEHLDLIEALFKGGLSKARQRMRDRIRHVRQGAQEYRWLTRGEPENLPRACAPQPCLKGKVS